MVNVAVVVLGDIGRSPRMTYHALSLSNMPAVDKVHMVGYSETKAHPLIANNDKVDIHPIRVFPISMSRTKSLLLWPFISVAKVLYQIIQLMWILLFVCRNINYVLVQSPPAIPTVFALQIICFLCRCKLIIDWHNLGYTLLQLSLSKSERHPIIRVAKWIERVFGRCAYAHLFVTEAMKDYLSTQWNLKGTLKVFHDKASPIFKNLQISEQIEFLEEFKQNYLSDAKDEQFLQMVIDNKKQRLNNTTSKQKNVGDENLASLIISSTSWTEDEDFSVLLRSIKDYEVDSQLKHRLLFIITGKGPKKDYYLEEIRKLNLQKCRVISVWLESRDYPLLLGSADVGVSLHNSSSGIDLPMKVVDMFGCCLPVLAVNFKAINELVQHERNGLIFNDSKQLYSYLKRLFSTFNSSNNTLSQMKQSLIQDRKVNTWESSWNSIVSPLIN
ncbi:glycosyltransferase [Tieghemostelium lacteum]|uniref:Glycosyltransferase n=1 Tax=Tieghemostelium lacteum TaxID=361077 RepID=A0A151Z423_TIELA|nr:glycosyltransferase [Tieghemostelium lacteum]|eukprot:KYQ88691.1 glycosyltransferase [Tieghemostelium lacteum]